MILLWLSDVTGASSGGTEADKSENSQKQNKIESWI